MAKGGQPEPWKEICTMKERGLFINTWLDNISALPIYVIALAFPAKRVTSGPSTSNRRVWRDCLTEVVPAQ